MSRRLSFTWIGWRGQVLLRACLVIVALPGLLNVGTARAELSDAEQDAVASASVLVVALVMEYQEGIPVSEYKRISLGSAALVSDDGYALTNNHVVDTSFLQSDIDGEAASQGLDLVIEPDFLIYVVDDRDDSPKPRYTASVVQSSSTLDLAILQINGDEDGDPLRGAIVDRTPIALAPPGPVANGDPVQVFGYPVFGGESFNEIGAKSIDVIDSRVRSLEKGPGLRNIVAIHLDAAVSGGSSGGPVVNDSGQLVGIMTEKLDGSGGAGEAVAIPIDRARGLLEEVGGLPPEVEATEPPVASPTPTPASSPSPTPGTAVTFLPPAFVGRWEGVGTQSNRTEGWLISVVFQGGDIGSVVGSVDYPTLGCGGELILESVSPVSVEVAESITYGFGACTDTGTFAFSFLANGTLSFHWWSEEAEYVSSGVLRIGNPDGADTSSTTTDLPGDTSQLDLTTIMPTRDDVPPGLTVIDDQQRTLEQSSLVYSNPADMRARYEGWGWRANALRVFGVPDGTDAAAESTTLVAVSIHAFGSADAAARALDYALNDEQSVFGQEEIVLAPVGDQSRVITGLTETGNESLVYTQRGTVLVVVSASSPSGNATADAVAIANVIVRNLDEACPGC